MFGIATYERSIPLAKVREKGEHSFALCSDAEPRLEFSMKRDYTILVDERLLLKFYGRMAALCVEDFTAPDGSKFKKGYWYSPMGEIRNTFKELYKSGETKLTGLLDENWAEVRIARAHYDSVTDEHVSIETFIAHACEYIQNMSGRKLSENDAEIRWTNTYRENY